MFVQMHLVVVAHDATSPVWKLFLKDKVRLNSYTLCYRGSFYLSASGLVTRKLYRLFVDRNGYELPFSFMRNKAKVFSEGDTFVLFDDLPSPVGKIFLEHKIQFNLDSLFNGRCFDVLRRGAVA